ncbi:hypothetical protein ACFSMW_13480 [Virgibacillus halophilus]|uniref:Uncharacterized protein n=1 Tax=Tigheibacillus halophilus TaxID=361280 RepID=A0ABU5C7Z5_9BACI|nr:hypothetical protein [Virgibacillus halophilus]
MKNELLLKQAIELLQRVNPYELEIVQIDNTKYDDGSVGFNVSLTYPAEEAEEVTISTSDGELVASISQKDGNAIVKDGFEVFGYDKD